MSFAEVAQQELLLLDDGHCLREQTMELCMQPEARESAYRATSLATLVQMVASGLGTSVLPTTAVRLEAERACIRVLPFASPEVGRTLRLAWRSRSAHGGVLAELADVMRQALTASVAEGTAYAHQQLGRIELHPE